MIATTIINSIKVKPPLGFRLEVSIVASKKKASIAGLFPKPKPDYVPTPVLLRPQLAAPPLVNSQVMF